MQKERGTKTPIEKRKECEKKKDMFIFATMRGVLVALDMSSYRLK